MKKILLILAVVLLVLIASGLVESNYCHYLTTTAPLGISEADYVKTTTFCRMNSYTGLVGALIIETIGLVR